MAGEANMGRGRGCALVRGGFVTQARRRAVGDGMCHWGGAEVACLRGKGGNAARSRA